MLLLAFLNPLREVRYLGDAWISLGNTAKSEEPNSKPRTFIFSTESVFRNCPMHR